MGPPVPEDRRRLHRGPRPRPGVRQRNRAALEQALLRYTKISSHLVTHISVCRYPTATDAAQIQRIADLMFTYGLLKTKLDTGQMMAG